jgi:hypothetical protein
LARPAFRTPALRARCRRGHVENRAIDHASLAASSGGEDSSDHAKGEAQRAASVAKDGRWGDWRLSIAGGERQEAAESQIIEIVGGDLGERTVLPPACHAPIDEARIALGAFPWAEAKALHHARPIALDQRVSRLDQDQGFRDGFGELQIEGDDPLAAPQRTLGQRPVGIAERRLVRADDCDDLRAQIREHATGKWTGPDPLELDNLQPCKRTHHP